MELKNIKERVEFLLDKYPPARNNDNYLIACYIYEYNRHLTSKDIWGKKVISLENFNKIPPFNSITRARRIIQNTEKRLLPTNKAVIKARRIKEQNYRDCEVREATNN